MNMVFVWGSNESGRHSLGAAKYARDVLGVPLGFGYGPYPMVNPVSFAIPTKDWNIHTLPLRAIAPYIDGFLRYALLNLEFEFKVSRIGCGLAGYTDEQIAPYFAASPSNCYFDEAWKPVFDALGTKVTAKEYWGTYNG